MKPATLISIVVIAAAAAAAAFMVDRSGRPSVAASRDKLPDYLVDGLRAKINDVAAVSIKRAGLDVTLNKTDAGWVLVEKGNYPARIEAIKQTVVAIAGLKPVERKTAKAENFAKLGVHDPETKGPDGTLVGAAGPALVTLKDATGTTLASIIVGNQKPGASGGASEVFVRKAGDTQAWLAEGNPSIPTDAMGWVERDVMNIALERTKSGTIESPDGQSLTASREKPEDAMLTVQNVPAGRELTSASAGQPIGYALTSLTLEDVAPAAQAGFGDAPLPEGTTPGPRAEFHTFDGLVIHVRTLIKGGKTWAKFDVAFDPAAAAPAPPPPPAPGDPAAPPPPAPPKTALKPAEEAKKEAADLQAKLAPWAFQLQEYKAKSLATKMDELLKPLTPPAPPPGDPAAPMPAAPPAPSPHP